jgi:glutaredoxin 3
MPQVDIYTSSTCPYCRQAKDLLARKNVAYTEKVVDMDPDLIAEAVERSGGRRTVPQIFINGESVGGYDEIAALEQSGRLDEILAQ